MYLTHPITIYIIFKRINFFVKEITLTNFLVILVWAFVDTVALFLHFALDTAAFIKRQRAVEQWVFCKIVFFLFPSLCEKTHYYAVFVVSFFLYMFYIKTFLDLSKFNKTFGIFFSKKYELLREVWFVLPIFWFLVLLEINEFFTTSFQTWSFMLTIYSAYVWFFFACFFSCYFICVTTYYFIMVGWHMQLYSWILILIFSIGWLYFLPYALPNSVFAIKISNFLFKWDRFIFVGWSGIVYLIGWLWYREYIQRVFRYYNSFPYTISIGNLSLMLLLDLFFNVFDFANWFYIITTYWAIISWTMIKDAISYNRKIVANKNINIYIYKIVTKFQHPYDVYFIKKMSLFYWILIIQYIIPYFSQPLNNFILWHSVIVFLLTFYCFIFYLCFCVIYLNTKNNLKKKKSALFYKKYILYKIVPCAILWSSALWFVFWLCRIDSLILYNIIIVFEQVNILFSID